MRTNETFLATLAGVAVLTAAAACAGTANETLTLDETSETRTPDSTVEENGQPTAPIAVEPDINITRPAPTVEVGERPDPEHFGHLIHESNPSDENLPTSVEEVVETSDVIAVGEVVDMRLGRLEYLGEDAGTGEAMYASYVNIVVKYERVISGKIVEGEPIEIEYGWGRNRSTDDLFAAAPIGNRVLILGARFDGARDLAGPLLPKSHIASNLVVIPSFGLVMEQGPDLSPLLPIAAVDLDVASSQLGINVRTLDEAIEVVAETAKNLGRQAEPISS